MAAGLFDVGWQQTVALEKFAGGLGCQRKMFTVHVWKRASASTRLEIRTQTPESIESFAIK